MSDGLCIGEHGLSHMELLIGLNCKIMFRVMSFICYSRQSLAKYFHDNQDRIESLSLKTLL